ncbi:hypothetical protein PM082_004014 [Marasmius tenuissimus]|nr:hypothetical protein PM082_004014 [Marasmius tenuissimus]
MVRSILKSKSPRPESPQSSQPSPSISFSRARHPRLTPSTPNHLFYDKQVLPFTTSPPTPHVHFPPTPTIVSSTHAALPSTIYDRAPIQVSPNSCALPERGGRVVRGSAPAVCMKGGIKHDECKGSYFHPFAFEACEPEDLPSPTSVPQLIPDMSSASESEESMDGHSSPHFSPIPTMHPVPPTAMSFLPYGGSARKGDAPGRPRLKRRKTPGSTFCHTKRASIEEPPSLDGCLGGF